MSEIKLVRHSPGAPGLRLLGLGPGLIPFQGMQKLKRLLQKHAFWAAGRNIQDLRKALSQSTVVVSLWSNNRMVGFGRATSDGIYRAVLWDIVVTGELQGQGLGRKVVSALLSAPELKNIEKIYLMTTNSAEFYMQVGFEPCPAQQLLVLKR